VGVGQRVSAPILRAGREVSGSTGRPFFRLYLLFEKPKQLQIRVLVLDGQSIREGILVRQNRYSDFKVLRNTGKSGVQNRPKTSPGQHPNHGKRRKTSKSGIATGAKIEVKNDPKNGG
jgi:hypothetical protein